MTDYLLGAATVDTLTITLTSLADGAYAMSAAIDNSTAKLPLARTQLILPSSITLGSSGSGFGIIPLDAPDGTNYPNPPGGTAGATGLPQLGFIPGIASAAFVNGYSNVFPILQCPTKYMLVNRAGAPLPSSGTFVLKLYRFTDFSA